MSMSTRTKLSDTLDEMIAKRQAGSLIADTLTDILLNDDDTPEAVKVTIRLVNMAKKINDTIFEKCHEYMIPGCTDTETQKRITEYLCSVQQNMTAFFDLIKKNGG